VGSWAATARVFDVPTGRFLAELPGNPASQRAVALSSRGKLVTAGGRVPLRLWDATQLLESGTPLVSLLLEEPIGVRSVACTPDGASVIRGTWNFLCSSELSNGRPRYKVRCDGGAVTAMCFSPDGGTIIAAGEMRWLQLRDTATGQPRATLLGHRATTDVTAAVYAPDGRTLVSAGGDGTIRLWNLLTEQELFVLADFGRNRPEALAFSPDGKILAATVRYDEKSTIYLWKAAAETLSKAN
jgi:WD40 repeat protein